MDNAGRYFSMEGIEHYFHLAIVFLFFTFGVKIMMLAVISTLLLSIVHRLLTSKVNRYGTNVLGFLTMIPDDQSVLEVAFQWIFVCCVYLAVYAGCLFGWAYYISLHPEFLS